MTSRSDSYHVVEPHPTANSQYIHTARGGAGNVAKATATTKGSEARGQALVTDLKVKPSRTCLAGRGGAGNTHFNPERAMFSFDEDLERQMRHEKGLAPVYHVGRGGAGNMIYMNGSTRRRSSQPTDAASARSNSSAESGADTVNRNIRRGIERGWYKVAGVAN